MVAGLFFPTLGALFWRRVGGVAAFWSIVGGGSTTVWLTLADIELTLDPVFYGLGVSAIVLMVLTLLYPARQRIVS
jgi:SSS family solute:Na+ symporter